MDLNILPWGDGRRCDIVSNNSTNKKPFVKTLIFVLSLELLFQQKEGIGFYVRSNKERAVASQNNDELLKCSEAKENLK